VVNVHQHLRHAPVVRLARAGYPSSVAGTKPGALYYKQPRGRPVTLCDAPAQMLAIAPDAEMAQAQLVNAAAKLREMAGMPIP
jgi:hypothetical protein